MFSILLPICVVIYDYQCLKMMQRFEFRIITVMKLLVVFAYWFILLNTFVSYTSDPV